VASRRAAWQAAPDLAAGTPVARADLLQCLGLGDEATTADSVAAAALRVAAGVLTALEPHHAQLEGRIEPDLPAALAGGQLRRLLTQP
jgi:hypothetical protein